MNYKKTEHFEPIAMKCTQEQFESIKPILEEFKLNLGYIIHFEDYPYLFNGWVKHLDYKTIITNRVKKDITNEKVYETFNAESFLKACGIVSEPLYQLTAKEVVHAYENPQYLKYTFKECFETELECGRWYKNKNIPGTLINCQTFNENVKCGYGVHLDTWSESWGLLNYNDYIPATEKEVEEALVKEAIKRGYENGNYKCLTIGNTYVHSDNYEYCSDENKLFSGWNKDDRRNMVFNNGIWAEILNTYTIQEAEEKFKIKIKAV